MKMKGKIIVLAVASLLVMMNSCSDDFIDPTHTTQIITDEQIAENAEFSPQLASGGIAGLTNYTSLPEAVNEGRHYDFGQKSIDIWTDLLSADMALSTSTYGWYDSSANLQTTTDFSQEENQIIWDFYFKIIGDSNAFIEPFGEDASVVPSGSASSSYAQARFYRAYSYFYLAQLFQREYNPNQEILPLRKTGSLNTAKNSASEIYDLIIEDLNVAIDLLDGYARPNKNVPDKTVAQGILAYVYAAIGNYDDAKEQADAVIASGYPLTPLNAVAFNEGLGNEEEAGFNNINDSYMIWGFDVEPSMNFDLISWYGQIDIYSYSYAAAGDLKAIDDGLYNQIPDYDFRKFQFNAGGQFNLAPGNKFYRTGREIFNREPLADDYMFMRVDEFYLLSAECAARLGNDSEAKSILEQLLAQRFLPTQPGYVTPTQYLAQFSGQDLIDEIYFQTRVELWGEGKSYFAMKRNQATVQRGTNHFWQPGSSQSYNSNELSFLIPQSEINNNPDINSQND